MIEIKNVTTNMSAPVQVKFGNMGSSIVQATLRPNDKLVLDDNQLKQYDYGAKQTIAEFISRAVLRVSQCSGVHIYQDKNHVTTYPLINTPPVTDPYKVSPYSVIPEDGLYWDDGVTGLQRAIAAFINIRDQYSGHALSTAYHTIAGAASAATDPTDLPSLIAQLGVLGAEYSAHIANAGLHPVVDTTNVIPVWVLATLQDCVLALRQLNTNLAAHRLQYYVSSVLTPVAVLTY